MGAYRLENTAKSIRIVIFLKTHIVLAVEKICIHTETTNGRFFYAKVIRPQYQQFFKVFHDSCNKNFTVPLTFNSLID